MIRYVLLIMVLSGACQSARTQTLIFAEDFESGGLPAGWARTQNTPSAGWEFSDSLSSQYFYIPPHTRYAVSNDDIHDDATATQNDASQDYLISPYLDLSPYSAAGIILEFAYVQGGIWGSEGFVEMTTDSGATWTVLQQVPKAEHWENTLVDISPYGGMSNVRFAFHHDDGGYWADGFAIDDVKVLTVPAVEGELAAITVPEYVGTGINDITAMLKNLGHDTIHSVKMHFRANGGNTKTGIVGGLSIPVGQTAEIMHPNGLNFNTPGVYAVEVWISEVNDTTDADSLNNFLTKTVQALSQVPPKYVVLEEHTGAWCGYCPGATVLRDEITDSFPKVIGVAIHDGDGMVTTDGSAVQSQYVSAYPAGIIDNYLFPGPGTVAQPREDWKMRVKDRLAQIVPVRAGLDIIGYNPSTRTVSISVTAVFFASMTADLRVNAWILEDSVTGTGPDYDQVNYFAAGSGAIGGAGHPYYTQPNPVAGFVHNRTLRAMIAGPWGTPGVIPPTVADGDTFTHTYTYLIPPDQKAGDVVVIGLVQEFDQNDPGKRTILNAFEVPLSPLVGTQEPSLSAGGGMLVGPNPMGDRTVIRVDLPQAATFSLEIYDLSSGSIRRIAAGKLPAGVHDFEWDGRTNRGELAASGVYFVQFQSEKNRWSKKLILCR